MSFIVTHAAGNELEEILDEVRSAMDKVGSGITGVLQDVRSKAGDLVESVSGGVLDLFLTERKEKGKA